MKKRICDYGISIGEHPKGKRNKITDVRESKSATGRWRGRESTPALL